MKEPKFGSPGHATAEQQPQAEREGRLPTISREQFMFLYRAGGEYRGYVEDQYGGEFEDIRVSRRVFYDKRRNQVVEVFVESAVGDGEGRSLSNPKQGKGLDIAISVSDVSNKELIEPLILDLYPESFRGQLGLRELRNIASELAELALRDAGILNEDDFKKELCQLMTERGCTDCAQVIQ